MRLKAVVVDGNQCVMEVAERAAELGMWQAPHVDPEIELCAFSTDGRGMCNVSNETYSKNITQIKTR